MFAHYSIPSHDGLDYYPLTVTEIIHMLEVARTAKKCRGLVPGERSVQISAIQIRLGQGIPGMTSPRPDSGEVRDRLADLDSAYLAWLKDPQTLASDEEVKPTDEITTRLCGLMGIQELS